MNSLISFLARVKISKGYQVIADIPECVYAKQRKLIKINNIEAHTKSFDWAEAELTLKGYWLLFRNKERSL